MPGLDGSGPVGRGPETGRGLGVCSGARRRSGMFTGRVGGAIPTPTGRGLYLRRGRRCRPAGFKAPR